MFNYGVSKFTFSASLFFINNCYITPYDSNKYTFPFTTAYTLTGKPLILQAKPKP